MEEKKTTGARADESAPRPARTRDEQATSGKTLSDLERTQADSATTQGGGSSGTGSSTEGASPSPEGASDRGGRADGSDTGGPM